GFLLIAGAAKPTATLSWQPLTLEEARSRAIEQERPLLVDFTAAWCGACKELDKHTFAEPNVSREAGRVVAVNVDATNNEDPKALSAMQALSVVGLPTVVVYDSSGKEALRYTDFVPPERFLEGIRAVQ